MLKAVLTALLFVGLSCVAANAGSAEERSFWRSISESQNYFDYDEYLRRYPNGDYARKARKRAERYRRVERRLAEEESLGLNRGQRREVEERLARAGFYPGSINGSFNDDTRRAIRDFRLSYGLPRSRFLDRPMLRALVRVTGDEYRRGYSARSHASRDGEVAAGVVAGALLLGGIILLAD